MEPALQHPSDAKLRDFSAGALVEAARAAVSLHLAACPACCQRLSELAASGVALSAEPVDATLAHGGPTNPGDNEDNAPGFLQPATRPGSLGRIGNYEVLQVLGKGGFGIVLRAFDDVLQRVVALKVMAPQLAATSPARKRFLREARSAAAVRHDNVVQIYKVVEQPLPYLVMEFIPGETLQQRLDRTGPMDVAEVLRLGRQIAEGLAAAHANDLIHRDIKPGNLLIEGGQRVKITDFGLARAVDDATMTQSGVIAGTPMYMAPEQALGHNLDQRADLFSLGSVLYQMVSGRPPFRAPSTVAVLKRVVDEAPRPIQEISPEAPKWLSAIIAKLHAKNPADRYQTAREVADVLADCEAQLKAHGTVMDPLRIPTGKPQRSGRWPWVAAAALLLPLIAFGVYSLTRPTPPSETVGSGKIEPPGSVAVAKEPDRATVPEAKKAPPQDKHSDRQVAEFVLSIGGAVQVNEQPEYIDAIAKLPSGALRLTSAHLVNNAQVTDADLARFKDCENLRMFRLSGSPQVSDAGLAHFKDLKNLEVFGLDSTKVTDAGLAHFKDCKNLLGIGLDETQVSDEGLAHFKDCQKLMSVNLQGTRISDAGLAYFKDCQNLGDLGLTNTKVGDAGLAHFKDCKNLTTLQLKGTRVSNAGLVNFRSCRNLQYLDLSDTDVSDAGLAHFKDCMALTTLYLSGTQVSDAGLAYLKDRKNLKELSLQRTKVTAKGIEELKKALPGCKIEGEPMAALKPLLLVPLTLEEKQASTAARRVTPKARG